MPLQSIDMPLKMPFDPLDMPLDRRQLNGGRGALTVSIVIRLDRKRRLFRPLFESWSPIALCCRSWPIGIDGNRRTSRQLPWGAVALPPSR
jgi:hypothetical protein